MPLEFKENAEMKILENLLDLEAANEVNADETIPWREAKEKLNLGN